MKTTLKIMVAMLLLTPKMLFSQTQLSAGDCGRTLTGITNLLTYDEVVGATDYEILVEGPGAYSQSLVRGNNSTTFRLSMFTGIHYNEAYTVRVRYLLAAVWSAYGDPCAVFTPVVPGNTKLTPANCGITLSTLDQNLKYNETYGATNYEIWVEGPNGYSEIQERGNNSTTFKLSWFSETKLGETYTVKVRSFVNGTWGDFNGIACTVIAPPVPFCELLPGDCGITLTTYDQILNYNPVQNATNYEIWVQGPAGYNETMYRNNKKTTFRLSWFPDLDINTEYYIKVRAYVDGVWGDYGNPCNVTTTGTVGMAVANGSPALFDEVNVLESGDLFFEAYPNPTNGDFTLESSHAGTFKIVNELGEEVQTVEIRKENNYNTTVSNLDRGVYFVTGNINNEIVTQKVMVIK